MDLRFLSYFVSVYEVKTVSGAAKACFISQPSLSNAIKHLEQELEVKLFDRFSRGVAPTNEGKQLYPLAKRLLADAQNLKQQFLATVPKTPFRLGLSKALGVERMSSLLGQFTNDIAHLELTLVDHLESNDARIVSQQLVLDDEVFEPIWHDRYLIAVAKGHPLALKNRLNLVDLDGQPFISRQSCEGQSQLFYALEKRGFSTHNRAKIQTVEYALGLVSAGVGIALSPNLKALTSRDDLCFLELDGLDIKRTIGLAYKRQLDECSALNQLMAICRRQ